MSSRAGVLVLLDLLVPRPIPPSRALLFDGGLVKIGFLESIGDFLGALQDLEGHTLM